MSSLKVDFVTDQNTFEPLLVVTLPVALLQDTFTTENADAAKIALFDKIIELNRERISAQQTQ